MSPCDVKALQECLRRTNGNMQKVRRMRLRMRLLDANSSIRVPLWFNDIPTNHRACCRSAARRSTPSRAPAARQGAQRMNCGIYQLYKPTVVS